MDPIQAIVLGIVQGLTEFIPVSSSAHLIIVPWLLGWPDPGLAFDAALHLGTLAAVLVYFARDWLAIGKGFVASVKDRRIAGGHYRLLAWLILAGSVPGGLAGVFLDDFMDEFFHGPGGSLCHRRPALHGGPDPGSGGAAPPGRDRGPPHPDPGDDQLARRRDHRHSPRRWRCFPASPVRAPPSRPVCSWAWNAQAAARFSFLLATPLVAGAGLKKVYDVAKAGMPATDQTAFALGLLAAAVSGYLCITFLLRYLQRNSTVPFVIYRVGLAAVLVVLTLLRAG